MISGKWRGRGLRVHAFRPLFRLTTLAGPERRTRCRRVGHFTGAHADVERDRKRNDGRAAGTAEGQVQHRAAAADDTPITQYFIFNPRYVQQLAFQLFSYALLTLISRVIFHEFESGVSAFAKPKLI